MKIVEWYCVEHGSQQQHLVDELPSDAHTRVCHAPSGCLRPNGFERCERVLLVRVTETQGSTT